MASIDLPARILYRDTALFVLDKPAGIAVHAGSGRDTALDRHFHTLRFGEKRDPALAHRLDKDTSGCLVLGRTGEALAKLGRIFQKGKAQKTYWAVVAGRPPQDDGVVDLPLARRSHDRRSWIMKLARPDDPAAETALTRYSLIRAGDGLSLVALFPETGRTHQLRVHCDALGCPIAGDPIYGGDKARALARQLHLHARRIVLPFHHDRPPVDVTAPVPPHIQALIRLIGIDPAELDGDAA